MRKAIAVAALLLLVVAAAFVGRLSSALSRDATEALEAAKDALRRSADLEVEGGDVSVRLFPKPEAVIGGLRVSKKKEKIGIAHV